MRYLSILLFLTGIIFFRIDYADAAMCGNGVTCFDAQGSLSNSNQSSPSPIVMYTAPSQGNGVKITGIYANAAVSSGATVTCSAYIVHSATNYFLMSIAPIITSSGSFANTFLTLSNGSQTTSILNLPTDENGNPYILLSAGDSIAIQNNAGIPSGGSTSGTYYFHIIGQAY